MTYTETLDFLFTSLPMFQRVGGSAYKANLDNTNTLDEYFEHPHTKFRTIHVAGTNGKGSVSHMLASTLQSAGYKVGLYTSPHLLDFRERIRVNGEMISQEDVIDFVAKHHEKIDSVSPSFFEMTVLMAFDYFAKQKVDIAVIEVGMGGRLDSTNIITPLVSVITNISYDHTQFLGDTLCKIAAEKAGIIKPHIPVVIGESDPETSVVFISKAHEMCSMIIFADKMYSCQGQQPLENGQQLHLKSLLDNYSFSVDLDLAGCYQQKNILTVITTLDILKGECGLNLQREAIEIGLKNAAKNTGLMGRWQVLNNNPYTICDTGHNKAGISEVVSQISKCNYTKLYVVLGVVNDKDLSGILPLLPKEAYYFFTQASIERALDANILFAEAKKYGLSGKVVKGIPQALAAAQAVATKDDMIYVGGSTFTVAELLSK